MSFQFSKRHRLWLPQQTLMANRKVKKVELGAAAGSIRKFYSDHKEALNPMSGLGKIVKSAEDAAEVERSGKNVMMSVRDAFDSQLVLEVREALSVLQGEPKAKHYLKKLVSGPLSSYDPGPSEAKDFFWELNVCHKLRKAGLAVTLDEPDVLWDDGEPVGIACKKIYNELRLQASLSKGVAQVKKWTKGIGFVAINIDELIPGTLQVPTWEAADIQPQKLNSEFYAKHDHHFRKYLLQSRLSGTLVACRPRVIIHQSNGRLGTMYTHQWQFFTRPGLAPEHSKRAQTIMDAITRMTGQDEQP